MPTPKGWDNLSLGQKLLMAIGQVAGVPGRMEEGFMRNKLNPKLDALAGRSGAIKWRGLSENKKGDPDLEVFKQMPDKDGFTKVFLPPNQYRKKEDAGYYYVRDISAKRF